MNFVIQVREIVVDVHHSTKLKMQSHTQLEKMNTEITPLKMVDNSCVPRKVGTEVPIPLAMLLLFKIRI